MAENCKAPATLNDGGDTKTGTENASHSFCLRVVAFQVHLHLAPLGSSFAYPLAKRKFGSR